MNDRQLANFLAVVDSGSFNKAAQSLYMAPQTLMQQINLLEAEVGVPLLERTNRGVAPTEAGLRFYDGARQIVELEDSLVQRSRDAAAGRLAVVRVGMQALPMLMPSVCLEFARACPEVELRFVNVSGGAWLSYLVDETVDVVEYEESRELGDFGMGFTSLVREPRWCIMSPNHPLAGREAVAPQDLVGQNVIVHNMAWLVDLRRELQEEAPGVRLEEKACDYYTVFSTCLAGGIYLAPRMYVRHFEPLVAVPLSSDMTWDFGLAYREEHSQAVDRFIEVARRVYGA